MPTFGYGTGGGSNRSGSRKHEEEKDEFDDILDSIVGKEDTGNRNIDPLPSSDPPRRRPGPRGDEANRRIDERGARAVPGHTG